LKTDLHNFARLCWRLISEVPGWPDAPRQVRVRRALPAVVPCIGILLLAGWNLLVRDSSIRAERTAHQSVLALDDEVSSLRLGCSDQQAGELAAEAAVASRLLIENPSDSVPILHDLKKEADSRNWEANLQTIDVSADTIPPDADVIFLPVRGRLTATPGRKAGGFPSLLALLEQFSASERRIDLTRLLVRADEEGRYVVELNLRLACRRPHEKADQ
jgi:hypothetical protein